LVAIDYWRILKLNGDYWRILEITKDYWRHWRGLVFWAFSTLIGSIAPYLLITPTNLRHKYSGWPW